MMVHRYTVVCLVVLVLSTSSGCMSARYTTNIRPPAGSDVILKGYKFNIEKVQYVRNGSKFAASVPLDTPPEGMSQTNVSMSVWGEDRWRNELIKLAGSRYPTIFSSSQNAHPLLISIRAKPKTSMPVSIAVEILTLTLFGGFLPLPIREVCDIEVAPVLLLDGGVSQFPLSMVNFQRRDVGWVSVFTPLALIPVPGRSTRREHMILSMDPNSANIPVKGLELTLENCLDAIVLSLQASEKEVRNALSGQMVGGGTNSP